MSGDRGKVVNFPDRPRHQVFIEPESAGTDEVYVAGLSSSLPEAIQEEFIRTVPGLERAEIVRPGYAIEYDVVAAEQLTPFLQLKECPGLFCAGQINGTSGYEEAAAQGIIAGINAGLYLKGETPFLPRRDEAYIGVLLDDLITKELDEPYRVMTSLRSSVSPCGRKMRIYGWPNTATNTACLQMRNMSGFSRRRNGSKRSGRPWRRPLLIRSPRRGRRLRS